MPIENNSGFFCSIFQQSPMNIAVLDREMNIVEANENFRNYFGDWRNKKCFQVYKSSEKLCGKCQAIQSFEDKKIRIHEEEGLDARGNPAHYVVHTSPILDTEGNVTHLIEMSQNLTDTLHQAREHQILFERVPCYICILDRDFNVVRANEKLRNTFGECRGRRCYAIFKHRDEKCVECPAEMSFLDGREHTSAHVGFDKDGKETHYIVTTTPLSTSASETSHVMEILTDITQIKQLERDMLDSERLAAVGQTVAGLAHTVKNILMGVEGGMYMVSSGIRKDDKSRIDEGWSMLQRNITKVTELVKDFLSFAKGRTPSVKLIDPQQLVDEIISLYAETARNMGIELVKTSSERLCPAALDKEGIHTCLTNLISNAIDACQNSSNKKSKVEIRAFEKDNALIFEVKDNGIGIEYDVKQKVFTTFFTTKGGKGTGLGLLTTRKIVQEHGGKIILESTPDEGSIFRIEFPRNRLPELPQ